MPPSQTPTCHSNTAFSAFNGHACLSSLPHGAMVPTQYHMTPYCSATETFGTFSHAFHSAVSPFSACAANGVVNQSDNSSQIFVGPKLPCQFRLRPEMAENFRDN